ncbi:hypothetical protein OG378_08995 [Streptomyces gougerotii]|nr:MULTISPECIES: hypothetical protein [unclassified Streptomyces]WSU35923.1 hypothetical protein OG378_08995 [Streptomyces gougerotii]
MRPQTVRQSRRSCGTPCGNRYDDRMVPHDVSDRTQGTAPIALCSASTLLLGAFGRGASQRLHVDLCRITSTICQG